MLDDRNLRETRVILPMVDLFKDDFFRLGLTFRPLLSLPFRAQSLYHQSSPRSGGESSTISNESVDTIISTTCFEKVQRR